MADSGARNMALGCLTEVMENGRHAQEALNDAFSRHPEAEERDRHLTSMLVLGAIEKKEALEHVIDMLSTVPKKKMKPVMRGILMLSLYQILFTEIPDRAAVNEGVKLAEKRGLSGLKGFVNGLLRHACRDRERLLSELSPRERAGIPEDLHDRLTEWHGAEVVSSIERFLDSPESRRLTARVNTSRASVVDVIRALADEGVKAEPTGLTPDTILLENAGDPSALRTFESGLFYIQDVSSALSGDMVRDLLEQAGEDFCVADVCAAPGGKTIHVLDLLRGRGHVTACDLTEKKVALIRENLERAGFRNADAECRDASVPNPGFNEKFDLVIADVPCSGLGILAKKPDIRLHWSDEEAGKLVKIQEKILDCSAGLVKPGGTLVFSTCTLNPAENEENLFRFLNLHADFAPVSLKGRLPEWALTGKNAETAEEGHIQLIQGVHPCDGFFMARLEKL